MAPVLAKRIARRLTRRPTAAPGPAPAELLRRRVADGSATRQEKAAVRSMIEQQLGAVTMKTSPWLRDAVAEAFERLWLPQGQPAGPPPPRVRMAIERQMNRLYYHVSARTWKDTWYRGTQLYKCPTDMWVYQEIIDELKPGLVVETGTFRGGSALFIADRLELAGHGDVVTVDITSLPGQPEHPRLTYLPGSSTDPAVLAEIRRRMPSDGSPVLVILDSDHSQAHVLDELRAYSAIVTPGSYLIVEDTNVNNHPVAPLHGPGPWEAVQDFLAETDQFEVDPRGERYFLTQNPSGYLRKLDTASGSSAEVLAPALARLSRDPYSVALQVVDDITGGAATPAVVLVLPGLAPGQIFAGVRTAIVAGATMAKALQRPLRIVIADNQAVDVHTLRDELVEAITSHGLDDVATGMRLSCEGSRENIHHAADVWMVTYWTTAAAVAELVRSGLVDPRRVAYLIQDFEPGFFPWGHQHALALATYREGFTPLVNSSSLARHLIREGIVGVDASRVFAPEIDAAPVHRAAETWSASADEAVRVLFYARPSKPRNMYKTGAEALRLWAAALPPGTTAVVTLAGEKIAVPPVLGDNVTVRALGKLSYADYYNELQHTDVGLALMLSPHPGHLALELPMSGIPTVTNEFVASREAWVPGLRVVAADSRSLAEGLAAAAEEARTLTSHESQALPERLGTSLEAAVMAVIDELVLD